MIFVHLYYLSCPRFLIAKFYNAVLPLFAAGGKGVIIRGALHFILLKKGSAPPLFGITIGEEPIRSIGWDVIDHVSGNLDFLYKVRESLASPFCSFALLQSRYNEVSDP